MSIHDIFKVPVYSTQLDLDIKKIQLLCNEHHQNNQGNFVSNIGGYQSYSLMYYPTDLRPLIDEIESHSNKFSEEFLSTKQVLSNIWININRYKDSNKSHFHAGADISGVYYVKTPDDCGKIAFEHPAIDVLDYYYSPEPSKEFNEYNSQIWWKPAVENRLYLFPSWLKHHVEPNLNKTEERVSISFNTIEKGE